MRRLWWGAPLTAVAAAFIGIAVLEQGGAQPLPSDVTADSIVVDKGQHIMTLYRHGEVLRSYRVALGRGGLAPKARQGDNRTPEGHYRIDSRNPRSAFHLALHVSYPDAHDVAAAGARGENPGGDIMIHGIRNGLGWLGPVHRWVDWTAGCIAVTDEEMDKIWRAVPDGTPVEIRR